MGGLYFPLNEGMDEMKLLIKEQKKIILAQYFEIVQISSSGKIYNKNIMKKQEFTVPLGVQASILDTFKKLHLN